MDPVNVTDNGDVVFVLDTETTSLDQRTLRITEIACRVHQFQGGRQETASIPNADTDLYEELVDPGVPVPEFITKLTGISDDMVQGKRRESEVVQSLLEWMGRIAQGRSVYVVAHRAEYDYQAVKNILARAGIPELEWTWICSLKAARRLSPGRKSYALGSLYEDLGFGTFSAHRAAADTEACAKVYERVSNGKTAREMAAQFRVHPL